MAKVLCLMTECKYCGRKSSKYQTAGGQPVYACKKDYIVICEPYDPESLIVLEFGALAKCKHFELRED